MVVSGTSAVPTSVPRLNWPSAGRNRTPVPVVPTVSMNSSPVAIALAASVKVAVTRIDGLVELIPSVPLFGLGLTLTPLVAGPVLSTVSVAVAAVPQLAVGLVASFATT